MSLGIKRSGSLMVEPATAPVVSSEPKKRMKKKLGEDISTAIAPTPVATADAPVVAPAATTTTTDIKVAEPKAKKPRAKKSTTTPAPLPSAVEPAVEPSTTD